jgi:hypothetical protein
MHDQPFFNTVTVFTTHTARLEFQGLVLGPARWRHGQRCLGASHARRGPAGCSSSHWHSAHWHWPRRSMVGSADPARPRLVLHRPKCRGLRRFAWFARASRRPLLRRAQAPPPPPSFASVSADRRFRARPCFRIVPQNFPAPGPSYSVRGFEAHRACHGA